MPETVRVAIYGCGRFANRVHIPNLLQIEGCKIVALCDSSEEAREATASRFELSVPLYGNVHAMFAQVGIDALYSIVPAHVHGDAEVDAAGRGIAIFSEKPQANDMAVARRIDRAIVEHGVVSSVGFRERYNPIFQRARDVLTDRDVIHVSVAIVGDLPPQAPPGLHDAAARTLYGGRAHDWGGHATDYVRFFTGSDVQTVRSIWVTRPGHPMPLSQTLHMTMDHGASMIQTYLQTGAKGRPPRPIFEVFYEGGWLAIQRHDGKEWSLTVNGELVSRAAHDPWLNHDSRFIEAVRAGDQRLLLNDYHDGLASLAPILAGWRSAEQGGSVVDVGRFLQEG